MFCKKCGNEISLSEKFCSKCGTSAAETATDQQTATVNAYQNRNPNLIYPTNGMLSPGVAALLSVFIGGLSQMILGQVGKGLVILGAVLFICFFGTLITCGWGAIVLVPLCMAIPAVDAYKIAQKLHNGKPVAKWEFF